MTAHTEGDDSRLAYLLLRWEELQEQGRSLSADELCSTCPELAEELGRRIALLRRLDPMLDATTTHGGEPQPRTAGASTRESASARAEFRDLRFHAAGALGEVFLARNAELNREVALKFIKPGRTRDPESLRRFLQEAEVTGGLEHPGVVPIYALGTDADGGPCYAMRFIRGETLQDAIDPFHAADGAGRDPSERSLALRELLGRFVSICNTMAYAHSRGVLHRDLKPRNVMLGKYDETLVVDWGLAKPFDRREEDVAIGEESLTPSGSGSGSDTPTVGIVGTPAYMSPEQAEFGSPLVGPASDIFGLGAILYTILTGQPPYRGRSVTEVLDAVRRCEFPEPRQVDPAVPRALEAVCLKAMSLRPEDRYATALDLAADVNRWLADEPVAAYPEPAATRVRRWVRRHPRLVTGSAAAMAVAAVSLLAIILVIATSNRRLGDANRTIRTNSLQIDAQNRELERRNQDLAKARGDAEQERDQAKEVTAFLVSTFRKPDPEMDGRDVKLADVLKGAVKELEGRPRMAPATRAAIFAAIGETYGGLGLPSESVEVFDKAVAVRRQVHGDDHPETLAAMAKLASACWIAGLYDRAIRLGEQVLQGQRVKLGDDHHDTLESMNNLAIVYEDSGQLDRAIDLFQQTLRAMTTTLGEEHLETVLAMHNLADCYLMAGQPERAIPSFEKAIAIYRVKKGANDPDTLEMTNNLARAYQATGQIDRAIALHEQILQARLDRLGPDHFLTLTSKHNVASAYLQKGWTDRAIPLLEQAVAANRARSGPRRHQDFNTMNTLARAYQSAGRLDRAIPLFEQALEGQQAKLGVDHGMTLSVRRNLARAYEDAGRLDDAERLFRQVVEAAARAKPRNDRFYSESLALLAGCLNHRREYARAMPILRECLGIQEKTQPDGWSTAVARGMLGEAMAGMGDYAASEPLLLASRKALDDRREAIPPPQREAEIRRADDRLIHLYEAWNKPAEAERWKRQRPPSPPTAPSTPPPPPKA
jgi:serine/threonine protein kinase/tetratricopeptide (TPR) repeat protein